MTEKAAGMKFSDWSYTRPGYSGVRNKMNIYKNEMQNASSYQISVKHGLT